MLGESWQPYLWGWVSPFKTLPTNDHIINPFLCSSEKTCVDWRTIWMSGCLALSVLALSYPCSTHITCTSSFSKQCHWLYNLFNCSSPSVLLVGQQLSFSPCNPCFCNKMLCKSGQCDYTSLRTKSLLPCCFADPCLLLHYQSIPKEQINN